MPTSASDPWPMEYAGIKLYPPLVYCPTHRKWEGYDESIEGLCDYCCLISPCPLGHDRGEGFDTEEDVEADREWAERQARHRHKTGGAPQDSDEMEIEYLDWS